MNPSLKNPAALKDSFTDHPDLCAEFDKLLAPDSWPKEEALCGAPVAPHAAQPAEHQRPAVLDVSAPRLAVAADSLPRYRESISMNI